MKKIVKFSRIVPYRIFPETCVKFFLSLLDMGKLYNRQVERKKIRIIYENEIDILNFYKIAFLDRTHTLKQHITVSPFHGVCQYSISNLYSKSTKERSKIVIHPVVHFQKYPSRFAFQFQNCRWDGIISVISIPNHASISSFFACSTRKFANLKLN